MSGPLCPHGSCLARAARGPIRHPHPLGPIAHSRPRLGPYYVRRGANSWRPYGCKGIVHASSSCEKYAQASSPFKAKITPVIQLESGNGCAYFSRKLAATRGAGSILRFRDLRQDHQTFFWGDQLVTLDNAAHFLDEEILRKSYEAIRARLSTTRTALRVRSYGGCTLSFGRRVPLSPTMILELPTRQALVVKRLRLAKIAPQY